MTRQEEIQKAAIEARCAYVTSVSGDNYCSIDDLPYIEGKLSYDGLVEEAFIKGAEWADAYFVKKQIITIDMWVARNKNAFLSIFNKKPTLLNEAEWVGVGFLYIDERLFPSVTFENSPKKVKVTIELEEEQ